MVMRYCPQCQQERDFRWALKVTEGAPFGVSLSYCVECRYEIAEEE